MLRNKARPILVLIWFGFFVADLCIVIYLNFCGWIGTQNFEVSFKQVVASYGPFLGAVVLFYFGSRGRRVNDTLHSHGAAILAIATSLLWNGIICSFFARLLFKKGNIEGSVRDVSFVGSMLGWIVSPALLYYFGKSSALSDRESGAE
jgi:hypothetical protein